MTASAYPTTYHNLQGSQESSCGRPKTLRSHRPFRRSAGPSSCQAMISWALQPPGLARHWPLASQASHTSWRRRLLRQHPVSFKPVVCNARCACMSRSAAQAAEWLPDHCSYHLQAGVLAECPVLTKDRHHSDLDVKEKSMLLSPALHRQTILRAGEHKLALVLQ